MTCPKCAGTVINQEIFVDGYVIDDIYCVNCGERFFKDIPTFCLNHVSQRKKGRVEIAQ